MQLKDVKESFIMNMHERFKFDSSSFVMLPSLSWKAVIETTRIELESLTDFKIIRFLMK